MKDLMLDIETMGITHNAVMIQLAAVFFDRNTGKTGKQFCVNIDMESCLTYGFEKTKSTEDWWMKQNPVILNSILENAEHVKDAMIDFSSFFNKETIVWSHSTFDFVIVQNYLRCFGLTLMNFRLARDIRTLVDLSKINLDNYDWNNKTHNALDDCKFQIQYCVDAIRMIK